MNESIPGFRLDDTAPPPVVIVTLSAAMAVNDTRTKVDTFRKQNVHLFVLDFGRITHLSSPWIELLSDLARSVQDLRTRRPGIALVGLDARIKSVLAMIKILGLSEILFAGSVEEAVVKLRGHDAEGPPPAGRTAPRLSPQPPGSLAAERQLEDED